MTEESAAPTSNRLHAPRPHTSRPSAIRWLPQLATALLVLGVSLAASSAKDDNAVYELQAPDESLLDRVLVPSRYETRLLKRARHSLQKDDPTAAIDVIRALLDQPADTFVRLRGRGAAVGMRATVRDLLVHSSPAVRRDWNRSQNGPARRVYRQALRTGNESALHLIAVRYPLTEAALDALLAESVIALRKGDMMIVRAAIQDARPYLELGLGSRRQAEAISRLERRIAGTPPGRMSRHTADDSVPVGPPRLPAANAEWTRRDTAWNYNYAPTAMPKELVGRHDNLLFGAQQPALTNDRVLVRNPAGLACLSRATGELQWMLSTPSIPVQYDDSLEEAAYGRMVHDRRKSDYCRPVVSNGIVWLADGVISDAAPQRNPNRNAWIRELVADLEPFGAKRLIAVNVADGPSLLWQTGSQPRDAQSSDIDRAAWIPEPRFRDHRFISAPVVHNHRLFAVSEQGKSTWLNCLAATSGHLIWQQPLGLLDTDEEDAWHDARAPTTAVCAVVGDAVICLQSDGLITGCRMLDGRIRWAQSVLLPVESQPSSVRLIRARTAFPFSSQELTFSPDGQWLRVHNERIYCGRISSPQFFCLDPASGRIVWTAGRFVRGGLFHGQFDLHPVGLTDDHLILVGQCHCRAIRLDDGKQAWAVGVGRHSGHAVCHNGRCLIPLEDGRVLSIDTQTGRIDRLSHGGSPATPNAWLAADKRGLVAVSSWAVTAWPWRDPVDDDRRNSETRPDELLNSLARHRLSKQSDLADAPIRAARYSEEHCIRELQHGRLTAAQQLRFAVLTPDIDDHRAVLRQALRDDHGQLVPLLPGWKVRLLRAAQTMGETRLVQELVSAELRDNLQHAAFLDEAILQPQLIGDRDTQKAAAEELLQLNRRSEAELLVLNMLGSADQPASPDLIQMLQTIRAPFCRPDMQDTPGVTAASAVIQEQRLPEGTSPLVELLWPHEASLVGTREYPPWYRRILLRSIADNVSSQIVDIEHETLQARPDEATPEGRFYSVDYSDENRPGLCFTASPRGMEMQSLLNVDEPTPLWNLSKSGLNEFLETTVTRTHVALTGPDGNRFLHPLTGEVLWSTDSRATEDWHHLVNSMFSSSRGNRCVIWTSPLELGYFAMRTADGAILREDVKRSDASAVGRFLYRLTDEDRLSVLDVVSGQTVAMDTDDDSIVATQSIPDLREELLLAVTDDSELLIVSLTDGKIVSRLPVKVTLDDPADMWMYTDTFQRHGRLYVSVNELKIESNSTAPAPFDEATTGHGELICLDSRTLQELWRTRSRQAVVPHVDGDPCSFIVLWNLKPSTEGPRESLFGFTNGPGEMLVLTLLDARTGRTIAEHTNLLPGVPLRCMHDAKTQTIQVTTSESVIYINYAR